MIWKEHDLDIINIIEIPMLATSHIQNIYQVIFLWMPCTLAVIGAIVNIAIPSVPIYLLSSNYYINDNLYHHLPSYNNNYLYM